MALDARLEGKGEAMGLGLIKEYHADEVRCWLYDRRK